MIPGFFSPNPEKSGTEQGTWVRILCGMLPFLAVIALVVWGLSYSGMHPPSLGGVLQVLLSHSTLVTKTLALIGQLSVIFVICLAVFILLQWGWRKQPIIRWVSDPFFLIMALVAIVGAQLIVIFWGLSYGVSLSSIVLQVVVFSAAVLVLGGSLQTAVRLTLLATWLRLAVMPSVNGSLDGGLRDAARSLQNFDEALAGLMMVALVALVLDYGIRMLLRRFETNDDSSSTAGSSLHNTSRLPQYFGDCSLSWSLLHSASGFSRV